MSQIQLEGGVKNERSQSAIAFTRAGLLHKMADYKELPLDIPQRIQAHHTV